MCGDDDSCNVLNVHMHPEPVANCRERCCMCCGYCTPIGVAILIAALVISSFVYYILVMKDYPDAWRIIVCIIFILITIAAGLAVLWAYYQVIFTRPGYVDRDPWKYRPVYQSPESLRGGLEEGGAVGPGLGSNQIQPPQTPSTATDVLYSQEDCRNTNDSRRNNPLLTGTPASARYVAMPSAAKMAAPEETASLPSSSRQQPPPREESDTTVVVMVSDGEGPRRRTHSPYEASPTHNVSAASFQQQQQQHQQPLTLPVSQQREDDGIGQPQRNPYIVSELDRWGNLRYCKHCQLYKPDHAYHCRSCKHCVYRFDHHCPFIANCVGRNNYRLFVLFLLYASVCCFIACVPMVIAIFAIDKNEIVSKVGWVAVPAVELILSLTLGMFYIQHRCLMAKGKSTVEDVMRQRKREQRMMERGFVPWSKKRKEYDAKHKASDEVELTEAQKQLAEERRKEAIAAHHDELWGTQRGWRAYLPYPLRTDDTADGIRHV